MNRQKLIAVLTTLLCMVSGKASAYHFYVNNSDGVKIYYNYINETEIEVTNSNGTIKYIGVVNIPESVTYNGHNQNVTGIGEEAFYNCSSLTSVSIPNTVTKIDKKAFGNCRSLTSLVIPDNVTSIGEQAFSQCTGLTSVNIPNGITSISAYTFSGCNSLTSIVIPDNVTSIDRYAFTSCYKLASVNIPNNVTSIGDNAFQSCAGLTSLILPNGITNIGNRAFGYCSKLTSVTIPNSLSTMGTHVFSGCSSLTSVTIEEGVTTIAQQAFLDCTSLTSLVIPNSITQIGYNAFNGCIGLESIVVKDGNTVYDSRENCNAIIITSSNTLFVGCKNTQIPESVTKISNYAFQNCTTLTSIVIPNSVTNIYQYAFDGCTGLTSVEFGNSITTIGEHAFSGCSSLTALVLPNSVTTIGQGAFGKTGIISVVIPNSVTSIGNYAFQNCSGLTSITSLIENPFFIDAYVFDGIHSDVTLYVPQGTKDKYKSYSSWNKIENIVESGESATISIADANGLATYCPEVGVDFSNTTDIAAYKASVDNSTVTLTRVNKVAAGEGVLIRSLNGGAVNDATVSIDIEATKNKDNAFKGTLVNKTLSEKEGNTTNFVLSKKNGVVGFYKANETTVAAGKAYLPVENYSAEAEARGLSIVFDNETTGICDMESKQTDNNDAVYTLDGTRVKHPVKGIYIKNGKKIVIKQ